MIRSGGSRISRKGGRGPRRWGRGLLRRLRFVKFVCQNERIRPLRGARARCAPLDPPMICLEYLIYIFRFCAFMVTGKRSVHSFLQLQTINHKQGTRGLNREI